MVGMSRGQCSRNVYRIVPYNIKKQPTALLYYPNIKRAPIACARSKWESSLYIPPENGCARTFVLLTIFSLSFYPPFLCFHRQIVCSSALKGFV